MENKAIKFTTRTRKTDGYGQLISIYVCNYVTDKSNTFLGKPVNKIVSSYTVFNKKYKQIK